MSVRFREWANSPSPEFPECDTRSISLNPGEFTSHLSLFTGMGCCNREPGLVRPYLRRFRSARCCSPSGAGRFAVRSCPTAVSLSPGASGSACQSRAAGQQGLQPHRPGISCRFPDPRPGWRALAGHSAAVVFVAAAPLASPQQVRSQDESHISGCIRCSSKIRSASLVWLRAQLCGSARKGLGNIPTSSCAPIYPHQDRLLSPVTSYVSRRPLLWLHLAWLDGSIDSIRKVEGMRIQG